MGRVRNLETPSPKWNVFIKPSSQLEGNFVEESRKMVRARGNGRH